MPTTDLRNVDTSPGADCPFAPPLGFEGGPDEYGAWLYNQFRTRVDMPQYMYVLWRFIALEGTVQPVTARGPYGDRLMSAMARFEQILKSSAPATCYSS